MSGVVLAIRCHWCSRQFPPSRTHQVAENSQTICDLCLSWHNRALDFLAGHGIPGCQICGSSWEALRDRTPGAEVRLYVVPRDGIYAIHCAACLKPYVAKRADLYRGTAFGAALRL